MEEHPAQNETPQPPRSVGRPTAITDDIVAKLEQSFRLGCTNETSCNYAEIDLATFYRHKKDDPNFAMRMDKAKEYCRLAASSLVVNDIIEKKNVETAKWWLEKKYKAEFGGIPVNQTNNQFNIEGSVSLENLTDEQLEQFIQSKNRQVRTSPVADGEAAPNSTQSTEIRETTPQANTGESVAQVNPGAILGEPGGQDGMGSAGNS